MEQSSSCLIFLLIFCSSLSLVNSQEDSCENQISGLGFNFDTTSLKCFPVWDVQNFILRFTKASTDKWYFVLSYPYGINSWAAIGFSSDGKMVGSSALAVWVARPGVGGTQPYYLGGTSENEVDPNGSKLTFHNRSFKSIGTSRVYLSFVLETSAPEPYLLYAIGPKGSFPSQDNPTLSKHIDKVSTTMDYDKGTTSKSLTLKLKRSHGVLNIAGWSILMIIGAIIARHCKQWDPIWFYLHASIQTIGFVTGIVGILCGLALRKKISGSVTNHKNIGILIFVLGVLQVIALVLRPGKESKIRKYWNWYHRCLGCILIAFAVVNTLYGLHLGGEGSKWFAGYGTAVALLVIIAVILEIRKWMISKRSSPQHQVEHPIIPVPSHIPPLSSGSQSLVCPPWLKFLLAME
ncbi:hypothetical protein L6164_000274 [Bauhinia variegata]|uniref:Uncharacterized protein n=1 Tax=Bauhinia variegata TaxID=167791 RepID=A0ACB9Q894_BAUVA|nr:hypothetical protein L6164_000274 [Bauhinia variegata]